MLHDEPLFGLAIRRNVALALWRDAPRLEWFRAIRDKTWPYAARWPQGAAWINLIVSGTPLFSEEVRREAAEVSKRDDIYGLGTAHIITLEGFKGTATRAFLNTIFLLARAKTPTKVFATPEEAAPWLVSRLGDDWTVEEIVDLCRTCEATLGLPPDDGSAPAP